MTIRLGSIEPLVIKQNALQPGFFGIIEEVDENGVKTPVDLTGATITAIMYDKKTKAVKINSTVGISLEDQITNTGEFQYEFQVGDTDTPSEYIMEFKVTPDTGGEFYVPDENYDGFLFVTVKEVVV